MRIITSRWRPLRPSAGALWVAIPAVQGRIHNVLGYLRCLPGQQRIVGCGTCAVLLSALGDCAQPRKAEQPGAAGAARPGRQGLSLRLQRLAREKCRGFSGHGKRRGRTCQAPGGRVRRGGARCAGVQGVAVPVTLSLSTYRTECARARVRAPVRARAGLEQSSGATPIPPRLGTMLAGG